MQPVDYEERQRYDFMACARNKRGHSACCFITVFIRDVNERPSFDPTSYNVDIPETTPSGMNILTVKVNDPDFSFTENARHTFALVGADSKFSVDSYGRIKTNATYDAETQGVYSFRVQVNDNGDPSYSAQANVLVRILDYNDLRPVINVLDFSVLENATGVVGVMSASDGDISPENKDIEYSIKPEGILQVDPRSGVITLATSLDYEKYQQYEFLAIATDKRNDQNAPYLTGIASFLLKVGNVNDNTPYFVTPSFNVTISEKSVVKTPVVQLYARDDDLPVYGNITNYIITNGNIGNAFQISSSGHLTTARPFVDQVDKKFTLTVIATDGEKTSAPATVIVNIADFADKQPFFLSNYYVVQHPESTLPNSKIVTVQAGSSEPTHDSFEYRLVNRNPDTLSFRIDGRSGEIFSTLPFNYEVRKNYTFDVEVTDSKNQKTNRASVLVLILDENDMAPVFISSPTNINITEFTLVGSTVGVVRASDGDSFQNGQVDYRVTGGTGNGIFGVNQNGVITLRENIYEDKKNFYTLTLEAFDLGTPSLSSAPLNINIFVHTAYTGLVVNNAAIVENSDAGTVVTTAVSVDAYTGNSVGMRYYLVGQSAQYFAINETSGRITVKPNGVPIDREQRAQHTLYVQSRGPTSTGVQEVVVTVIDQNDNAPRFSAGTYRIEVSEATSLGTTLYRVVAEDDDVSPNNLINYSLDSGDATMFSVNPTTGDITLLKALDYEVDQQHQIVIKAANSPASSSGTPGQVTVLIAVQDYNDNCPKFTESLYEKNVTENNFQNPLMFSLAPSDGDLSANLQGVACSISEPLAIEYFAVSTSGNRCIVTLKKALDYEQYKEFRFALTATNTFASSTTPCRSSTNLLVNVIDIPDQPVRLEPRNYVVNISESALVGSLAVLVKAISQSNNLTFNLLGAAGDLQKFQINANTGEIILMQPVDRETQDKYLFNVTVSDGFSSDRGSVTINILDVNDNAPSFNQQNNQCYQQTLSEISSNNTDVTFVSARDRDSGQNAAITYSLVPTVTCHSLVIDSNSGRIQTSASLDFESRDLIHCLIRAEDKGQPSLIGYSCLTVTLSNHNDHRPVFDTDRFDVEVQESAPVSTLITVVHATDRDGPSVLYRINAITPSGPFMIDANGKIMLNGPLDFENVRDYEIEVVAFDTGVPSLSSEKNAIVNVKVTAVNDNRPVFGKSYYRVIVPENQAQGSTILNVTATDEDHQLSPLHKQLRFSALENTTDFTVDPITGAIRVAKPLDFERRENYNLVVVVRDMANTYLTDRAMVDVVVTDLNDNQPIFLPSSYNIRISEKTLVDTPIVTLSATDNDAVDNGGLAYAIRSGSNGFFDIDGNKVVLKKELDYENPVERAFQLFVTVKDPRDGTGGNEAIVTISVADINDREAVFDLSAYEQNVQENFAAFATSPLLTVRALDSDGTAQNNNLVYSIIDDSPDAKNFRILTNNGQGVIYANKQFDYEEQNVYHFLVKASDTPRENLTGIASVTIRVTDLNDNAPTVENDKIVVNISETTKVFSTVAIVFATDQDSSANGQLKYQILNHAAPETFTIKENQGVIQLVRQLDYLVKNVYNFQVRVYDQGSPSQSKIVDVTVYVHRTVLAGIAFTQKHYVFSVEDRIRKQLVGTVEAKDTGTYVSQRIDYLVVAGQSEIDGMFIVINATKTGLISMAANAVPDYDQKKRYTFMVRATNERGAVDYAQVTINVVDINEPSRFVGTVNGRYEFSVIEAISIPSYVFGVIVKDDDDGVNANIKFSLQNPAGGNFSIDDYGRIQILQQPDREQQSQYFFTVSATDESSSPLTTSVQIICTVLDYNDNRPIFYPQGVRQVFINEGQNYTTPIMTLFANDTDTGVNRNIIYPDVYPSGWLSVDTSSGQVRVVKPFDYELGDQYEFVAVARDLGSPYLTSYQRILVNVRNMNDEPPYFILKDYNITISEVSPVGMTFLHVPAVDDDHGQPGTIRTYEMTEIPKAGSGAGGADSSFGIDQNGWVSVKKPLNYNTQNEFVYTVKAFDNGVPSKESINNAIVRIQLREHSELQPKFLLDSYIVSIYENTTISTSILKVEATSPEINLAGPLTYRVVRSSSGSVANVADSDSFFLSPNIGQITTLRSFDYENKKQYIFEVEAQDSVNLKTNRALVIVNILDVNDNPPLFTQSNYIYNISEATRPGQIVTILQATDQDSEERGQFRFSSIGGDTDKFGVNADGKIILLGPLDHRLKNTYRLNVKAEDLGTPSRNSVNTVTIYVHKADLKLNTPIFNAHLYRKCIDENQIAANLVQVNATNSYPVSGSTIIYSIDKNINPAESAPFIIDRVTGQITLSQRLDYEAKKSYDFLVVATNDEGRTDVAVVSICVNDVNDNPPRFQPNSARVNLTEAAYVGTIVYVMTVVDDDSTNFKSDRVFAIVGGDASSKFTINNDGVIKLNQKIDYEAIRNDPKYTLVISLTENNQVATGTVRVDVTDWNDNRPNFNQAQYTFNVARQLNVDDVIGNIPAFDLDATLVNNQVNYSILTTDTHFQMRNQQIVLREQLAYDGERFEFVVVATDNGYLNLRKSALVVVNVADLNNHNPEFAPEVYNNTVSEAAPLGTTVIRVYATDGDKYPGKTINYVLTDPTDTFQINNQGYITLKKPLNFEQRNSYAINVTAVDDGGLTSPRVARVFIGVVDVNEMTPVFDVLYYERVFPEDTLVQTEMVKVNARDSDGTGNAVTYSLVQQNDDVNKFSIDSNTGAIRSLLPFDYETQKLYTFSVKATDSATKRLDGVAHVTIRITDVNDNVPVFINYAQYAYNVTVEDNIAVGTLLTVLSTGDKDSGDNAKIDYNIVSGNEDIKFSLDQNGQIRLLAPLDASLKNRYRLLVSATDRGDPKLSSQHNVTINVLPYTDSLPVFNPSYYERTVSEDILVGTSLVDLIYTKTKPGSPVTLSIHPHTVFPEFKLNGSRLELNSNLDYERKNLYSLIVLATDEVKDVAVAQVVIRVINVNEHAPVFNPANIVRSISEHAYVGHSVLQLSASDQDANAVQSYRVDGTIPNNYFILSPTGSLTVARELTPGTYNFKAIANDGKFDSNVIDITVVVTPETDLKFRNTTYVVTVSELLALQSLVVSTSAGTDQQIQYTIASPEVKDTFAINRTG